VVLIFCWSSGDFVSQVVACPNCEKKLTVMDELLGRTLVCPQCNGRFTAPADVGGAAASETSSSDGADMGFLDSLSAGPRPAAGKTAAPRPAAKTAAPRSSAGKSAASSPASAASRAAASREKAKNDQKMVLYIGGGIAAAVLLVVLLAVIMSGGSARKRKDQNIRLGMAETQRRELYRDLIHAIDVYGPNTACREEWRRLGSKWKLTDQQIASIRDEGLDHNWTQAEILASMDQKQKTNRIEWVRIRTETKVDPIMP
jgi:hypothetical protein